MGVETVVNELNKLYKIDMDKYLSECSDLKRMGYKIYRNSDGEHKVIEPIKHNNVFGLKYNDLGNVYGGVFNDIFGNIFGGQ